MNCGINVAVSWKMLRCSCGENGVEYNEYEVMNGTDKEIKL